MNPRGKRLTLGVMAVGLAVFLVLVIAHWGTVRDHIEAWHFQLTRETVTIEPDPALTGIRVTIEIPGAELWRILRILADYSGRAVLFARDQDFPDNRVLVASRIQKDIAKVDVDEREVRVSLKDNGYRILDQRFPRKAYVVIRGDVPAPPRPLSQATIVRTSGRPSVVRTRITQDLRSILTVAEAIYVETGRYPTSIEAMVFKDGEGSSFVAALEKHPKDPWGYEYLYEILPDGSPRVRCLGSDNQPGGEGDGADTILPNEEEGGSADARER